MKKLFFTLALLTQAAITFAFNNAALTARATADNVKVYRQAGTSTEVVKALKSTDEVMIVRQYNNTWTIVTVDGAVGYVLTSEIAQPKLPGKALVKTKAKITNHSNY